MSEVNVFYDVDTPTYYVDGAIYDENGKPLSGCSTQLVVNATGQAISSLYNLPDNTYSAWVSDNPYNYAVIFRAKGYKEQKIQVSTLIDNPDITMVKASGNTIEPWMILLVVAAVAIIAKKKKKVSGSLGNTDVITIFYLVGGVLSFILIKQILEKLGFWGGKDVSNEQTNPGSEWKPGYWKQFTSFSYAITSSQAMNFAKQIHDAFTVWQDDFNTIFSVFSQMRTKANVSFLADVFQTGYGEDLLTFLTDGGGILPWDGLSTAHMTTLINLVNKLPSN
jgi:hypothetical protein